MNVESYLALYPDGSFKWIRTLRSEMMRRFKEIIGCRHVERVSLPFGFCCFVDEVGKMKKPPQPLNSYASRFYPGTFFGDPLVGPVVFFREDVYDGEYDVVPLTKTDVMIIEIVTGLSVPALC